MRDINQIAAEAWKQITDYADNCEDGIQDLQGDTNCIRIIKSAIEEGIREYDERICNHIIAMIERLSARERKPHEFR